MVLNAIVEQEGIIMGNVKGEKHRNRRSEAELFIEVRRIWKRSLKEYQRSISALQSRLSMLSRHGLVSDAKATKQKIENLEGHLQRIRYLLQAFMPEKKPAKPKKPRQWLACQYDEAETIKAELDAKVKHDYE